MKTMKIGVVFMRCLHFNSFLIAFLTYSFFPYATYAEENITFGVKPAKKLLDKERHQIRYEEHLVVNLENGYALLYEDVDALEMYLSIIRDGKEIILWRGDDLGATSLQVPPPVLATMKINSNETFDLIFIYSTNLGIGSGGESWERDALLFFDGKRKPTKIKTSSVDILFDFDKEPIEYYDSSGSKPAHNFVGELFLKTYKSNHQNIIYFWSTLTEFGGPENIDPRRVKKMAIYGSDGKRSGPQKIVNDKIAVEALKKKLESEGWIKLGKPEWW